MIRRPRMLALTLIVLSARTLIAQGVQQAGAPYPPPRGDHPVAVERSFMVPMRDGVKLATDIYRPTDLTGPLPAILIRTPYNKQGSAGAGNLFASHGYVVVIQDVRGKFESEGQYRVYEGDMTDWTDAFDWIGAQSWSSKRIGSYGCSYLGEQQIIAAQQRHPMHIAAIAQAAGGNLGRVGRHRTFWGSVEGGANAVSINFGWMPVWASDKGRRPTPQVDFPTFLRTLPLIDMTDRAGSPSWDWRNFLERSPDDPWWDKQGYLTADDSVSVAALHVSSWFDMASEALEERAIFQKNGTTARAREGQYAIISPTAHCSSERAWAATKSGTLEVGDARLRYWETYLAWFDRWLRGNEHAIDSVPHIQYYTIGGNAWRSSDRWPVTGMRETAYYLRSEGGANTAKGNGRLSLTAPQAAERADTFTYDPANPVPSRGGSICCTGDPKDVPGSFDNTDIEQRPDVLVYTTDVLPDGLELTGPMRAVIHLSSNALDTDVTAKLLDVFPDGRAMNMVEGITRVRYRDGFDKPRMMQPGTVYEVPVDLHATSWFLAPGHRLRVEISSSSFPRFDRNLNTGGRNYDETTWRVAKNSVHHTAARPSRLILPVVPNSSR
mgnify:CR=1 FL=1